MDLNDYVVIGLILFTGGLIQAMITLYVTRRNTLKQTRQLACLFGGHEDVLVWHYRAGEPFEQRAKCGRCKRVKKL